MTHWPPLDPLLSPRGFIAGPKCSPGAWRTPESTFQPSDLRLIGGFDEFSVDMGPRRDASFAKGEVMVQTLGAVRAGWLVRTIGYFYAPPLVGGLWF